MKTIVRSVWAFFLVLGMSLIGSSCQNSNSNNEILTRESFMNIIAEEKLTMVDFYTTWCGPCKMMDPFVKEIRFEGLFIGVELIQSDLIEPFIKYVINKGVLIDFFLFDPNSFRIAPPLIIEYHHLDKAIEIIIEGLNHVANLDLI
jgi:acetylornithine/succinyldiaminopimelate/putrescine aminotransferase